MSRTGTRSPPNHPSLKFKAEGVTNLWGTVDLKVLDKTAHLVINTSPAIAVEVQES